MEGVVEVVEVEVEVEEGVAGVEEGEGDWRSPWCPLSPACSCLGAGVRGTADSDWSATCAPEKSCETAPATAMCGPDDC